MLRRLCAVPMVTAFALLTTSAGAAPPAPQVTDTAGDANFANPNGMSSGPGRDKATPGSQEYADVISVLWQTTKTTKVVRKKRVTTVTGFTVTATLTGAPTPPQGTAVVYRMMGRAPNCPQFGVAYYTSPNTDTTIPQSALRENCNHSEFTSDVRLTAIPQPVINGSTITWTVPLSAIPKDTKVTAGTKLIELWFQVNAVEDFHGQCLPSDDSLPKDAQTNYGGACGLATGVIDDAPSSGGAGTFTIGS